MKKETAAKFVMVAEGCLDTVCSEEEMLEGLARSMLLAKAEKVSFEESKKWQDKQRKRLWKRSIRFRREVRREAKSPCRAD